MRNCLTAKPELIRTFEIEIKKEVFQRAKQAMLDAKAAEDGKGKAEELTLMGDDKEDSDDDVINMDSDGALI